MRRNRGGFTILEVMIFLAISGAMLAAAMVAINGQQNRTEFTEAMRDIDSKLQDTLNDVSTGNFSYNNQGCSLSTIAGVERPGLSGSSTGIGSNQSCVFLGEALQFSTSANNNNNARFAVYTVLGRRLKDGGVLGTRVSVNSFSEANPTAMIGANGDLTTYYDYAQGITASHIYYTPAGGGPATDGVYTLLGIYSGFNSAAGSVGNSTTDGSQTLQADTYKLANATDYNTVAAKSCIDNTNNPATPCPFDSTLSSGGSKGFGICFDSNNGTRQTALITIYNASQGVSTRLEFSPAGTCPAP